MLGSRKGKRANVIVQADSCSGSRVQYYLLLLRWAVMMMMLSLQVYSGPLLAAEHVSCHDLQNSPHRSPEFSDSRALARPGAILCGTASQRL